MDPTRNTVTDRYAALHGGFRWHVPEQFNIAEVCCARWARATPNATAIIVDRGETRRAQRCSYAQLQGEANRLANALVRLGVQRGDRIAIVMPQRVETAVAHIAAYQLGAVAMPLSMLFGPDALEYRLNDSSAVLAIADESSIASLRAVRSACPALRTLLAAGDAQGQGDVDWDAALGRERSTSRAVQTSAEDPAVLIYTSGTTGPPKGALIPHRALIGNLSGFVCSQNWFGFDPWIRPSSPGKGEREMGGVRPGRSPVREAQTTQSVFWSRADWAWTGGLMDALLPTLYFGRPIVASRARFDPLLAFELLERHRVTHTFLFPTALKAMMKAQRAPRERFRLRLQAIMSAGEAVGDAVFAWCRDALGVTVNEMFGQTEIN